MYYNESYKIYIAVSGKGMNDFEQLKETDNS